MNLRGALLLGGGATALPAARSLARAGIHVSALGFDGDVIRRSRYCSYFEAVGSDPAAALTWLRTRRGREVLLPCSDETLEVVARNYDELAALDYVLPEFSPETVLAMLDKDQTYRIAAQAGIPVPQWRTIRADGPVPDDAELKVKTYVVKPLLRHQFQRVTGSREKVVFTPTKELLDATLKESIAAGVDVMVTEVVPGPDSDLWSYQTYVGSDGRPLFDLTLRKIRQEPPNFGVATLAVGEWNSEVAALGRRFADAAGLRGPIEIEFKRDVTSGVLKLIECNHRLNFLVELVRCSGFDLVLLTYAQATSGKAPAMGPVRWGYRLWHPWLDARAIREYRREGALALTDVLASVATPRLCFTVWAPDDPLPGLQAAGQVAGTVARKVYRRAWHRRSDERD